MKKLITMVASTALEYQGARIRQGQTFQATAIDAVILTNKRKAKIAKSKPSKPAATTAAPATIPARVESTSDVQTSQMEPVSDVTDEQNQDQPSTGRGRYRRQDLRARA